MKYIQISKKINNNIILGLRRLLSLSRINHLNIEDSSLIFIYKYLFDDLLDEDETIENCFNISQIFDEDEFNMITSIRFLVKKYKYNSIEDILQHMEDSKKSSSKLIFKKGKIEILNNKDMIKMIGKTGLQFPNTYFY